MKPFPANARIEVPAPLAATLLKSAKALPLYEDAALRDLGVQATVREAIARSSPEGFAWLVETARAKLSRPPHCTLISGMTFDEANLLFVALTSSLGDLVEPYQQSWSNLVRRIQPSTDRRSYGYGALNEQLHTDGTDWPRPNDLTCLLCVRPDQRGHGRSHLLDMDELTSELERNGGAGAYRKLQEVTVPWRVADEMGGGVAWAPVFSPEGMRYLRYTIDLALEEEGVSLDADVVEALNVLDRALINPPGGFDFALRPNDLLLVNNKSCLHARTAIPQPESSERLILRVKVFYRPGPQNDSPSA